MAAILPASKVVRARNARYGLPPGLEAETLANFGRYLGEFFSLGCGEGESRDRLRSLTGAVDVTAARRSIEAGRAALTVTPHFGNWELGARILGDQFGPVAVIYRTTGVPALDAAMTACRGDNRMLDVADGTREILSALSRPGVVAAAIDEPRSEGIPVEFLGRTVHLPAGLFRMAERAGAAIHPTRCRRNADGRIDFHVFPEAGAGAGAAQVVADHFAEWIRADPAQWMLLAPG